MKKLFLTSLASKSLDKVVPLLGKLPSELKVAFVPTAGDPFGDHTPWIDNDRKKLVELGFEVFEFSLKNKTRKETLDALSSADVIFVAGGNTFYLLQKARECGFDEIVKELINDGRVYIGSSAGSVLVGPDLEPVSVFDTPGTPEMDSTEGLNLVDFVILPHFDEEQYSSTFKEIFRLFGDKYKLITLANDQLVYVTDDTCEIL